MVKPIFIGLTGYAGTGKDTVRAILEDCGLQGFAFADPIKHMARALLHHSALDTRYMDHRELKEQAIPYLGFSYRQIAQTLGTEWGRALAPDIWLRLASARLADFQNAGLRQFVVSDVRFQNEADWVRQQGGIIWRIHRNQAPGVRDHVSETELDSIRPDATIHNNASLQALRFATLQALGAAAA